MSGIDAPTTARPTYLAYVGQRRPVSSPLLLDPVSAELLGELPDRSFVRTLQDLHFDLLAGRTGRIVNGIGALLLLAMCLTGLVIWWPGAANWRRGFTVDFRRSWKRVNWDLHSAVGIWTWRVIAHVGGDRRVLRVSVAFRAAVNAVSPLTVVAGAVVGRQPRRTRRAHRGAQLIDEARRQRPASTSRASWCRRTTSAAFLVMFSSRQADAGGQRRADVGLSRSVHGRTCWPQPRAAGRTAGDVVMAWVAPLHVGNFGGIAVRVAWLVLGLSPPLLFVTGFIMWWTRVVRPQRARARAATRVGGISRRAACGLLAPRRRRPPDRQPHRSDGCGAISMGVAASRFPAPMVSAQTPMTPSRIELGRRPVPGRTAVRAQQKDLKRRTQRVLALRPEERQQATRGHHTNP